jgi:hypothetical protein
MLMLALKYLKLIILLRAGYECRYTQAKPDIEL